jgi:streptomycin 3"-adenylyltransferase
MPGFSLDCAPQALRAFLDGLVGELQALLAGDLAAVILHGSLAMGSFHPPKSDLDLLVVTDGERAGRQALYDLLARAHARRPYAGGVEASVLRLADLAEPRHPLPYIVHFSETTRGPQPLAADGSLPRDPDLCAHLMVARTRGVSLHGPPPAALIGPLSWDDYLASVRSDIDGLMDDGALLASPRYAVLNLCRWAMLRLSAEPLVPSKDEAGGWAQRHAPAAVRPAITQALAAYRSADPVTPAALQTAGGPWNPDQLRAVRDWVRGLG